MKKYLLVLFLILPCALFAQDVKFTALFILNFAKYIDWPQEAVSGDYQITVVGDDPVVDELKNLAAKTKVGEHGVQITKVATPAQVGSCHIIYISPDMSNTLPAIAEKWGATNTLIVTNKKGLAKEGAAINLTTVSGQMKYEINTVMMKKNGLKPKPVLFKLGTVIES